MQKKQHQRWYKFSVNQWKHSCVREHAAKADCEWPFYKRKNRAALRNRNRDVRIMRRCDTQQLTEESIMELIRQRGNLRFSTLMVLFHISRVEALAVVEEYQKKGILDAKGKYVPEGESGAAVLEKEEGSDGEQSEVIEAAEEMSGSERMVPDRKGKAKKEKMPENRSGTEKTTGELSVGEKIKTAKQSKVSEKISVKKQKDTVQKAKRKLTESRPPKRKEQPKKKLKSKKLIQRNLMKPTASDVEGQISLFDYMQFGG